MSIKTISFTIEFGKVRNEKLGPVYPFKVVSQTRTKSIERECKKRWPRIMSMQENTIEDNMDLAKMRSYIINSLTTQDKDDIHELLYDRGWLAPFDSNDKITTIKITTSDCKTWSDPEIPYLEIGGEITTSMPALATAFCKRGWIQSKTSGGIASETAELHFMRSVPLLIRYMNAAEPFEILLRDLEKSIRTSGSILANIIAKVTKFKNAHTMKSDVTWGYDKSTIKITYKDTMAIIAAKAKRSPIAYGVAAYAAYKYLGIGKNK